MLDFLRDPVWGGIGVLVALVIAVGSEVLRRAEMSRGEAFKHAAFSVLSLLPRL